VKCIDDEIPFEIPEGWEWERWGNVSYSIQYGYNAPAKPTGDILMVRISDIQNNQVVWDGVPYCDIEEKEIPTYLLRDNDILFARTGGTVGKSFLVKQVPERSIYAGYLIRTQYNTSNLCPEYLKAFMESQLYWEQLKKGTIATAQPNCNGQTLGGMLLPIPPFAEQRHITEKLTLLTPILQKYSVSQDSLDYLNDELNNKLKKSILQEAIQGKLVPQDPNDEPASVLLERIRAERERLIKEKKIKRDKNESIIYKGDDNSYYEKLSDGSISCIDEEIPFDIPSSWNWVRLGSIFQHNTGKALNGKGNGTPREYITTSNLYWNSFDFSKVKVMNFSEGELDKCTATKGDLLVCEGGDIGRTAIWNFDYDICIQNHIHKLRPYVFLEIEYFYNVLHLYKGIGKIGGKGIGILGLSSGVLHNILVPCPPVKEQKCIVQKINALTAKL